AAAARSAAGRGGGGGGAGRTGTDTAIAGPAPTSTSDGKQNQSGRSDRPSGPSRIQSWTQPWPRLPSQTASVTAGSSRTLRLKPGTIVAKAATAAAMPVANAAICSMTNCGSDILAIKSLRGDTMNTTSAT